jgi:hypothetical protein
MKYSWIELFFQDKFSIFLKKAKNNELRVEEMKETIFEGLRHENFYSEFKNIWEEEKLKEKYF